MNIKKTIFFFDIDGLLLDSEGIYLKYWVEAAYLEGYILSEEMALELRSLDSQLAKKLFTSWFNDDSAYEKVRTKRKELMKSFLSKNDYCIKKGALELLLFLKTKGITLFIVTSNARDAAITLLEQYELLNYFTDIISTKECKRGKPYPDAYEYAISLTKEKYGDDFNYIAIEDSPNGVISAYYAGCKVVMIPDLTPLTDNLKPYVYKCFLSLLDFNNYLINNHK